MFRPMELAKQKIIKSIEDKNEPLFKLKEDLKKFINHNSKHYQTLDEQLKEFLKFGNNLTGFSVGIISKITGQEYKIIQIVCKDDVLKKGGVFELKDTICRTIVKCKESRIYDKIKGSDVENISSVVGLGMNSYLGCPIIVNNEIYGTLNFSKTTEIENLKEFQYHFFIIEIMAQLVGLLIAKHEQSEQVKKLYLKDITKQNQQRENLEKQLDYERDIVKFTHALLQKGPNEINNSLKFLLNTTKSSRVYIFENFIDEGNRLSMKQTHEACAPGVQPEIDNPMLQHVVYERDGFKWWADELTNDFIINGVVSNFPESILKEMLQQQAIKSILIIPLWAGKKFSGFIGFDDTVTEKIFSQYDIDLLRSASEIVGINIENVKNRALLIEKNQMLKEAISTKDRFISILAHDLKSPFNSIVGFSQLLAKYVDNYDKEKIKEFGGLIYNSAKQTYNLLNNLLDWSRSHLNEISYNPQQTNVLDIIQETCNLTNSFAESKNIKIELEVPKTLSIVVDREMIKTVIRNLVNNSVKFTKSEGCITISAKKDGDKIQIQIADTGIGMSETIKKSLFKIGETVANFGTAGEKGTGFGLLLCKEFIEKHNGAIRVESEEGKGTLMIITLPI